MLELHNAKLFLLYSVIQISHLSFILSGDGFYSQGSFGEILKACWRGTPVAVKRILPSLSDDRLVT